MNDLMLRNGGKMLFYDLDIDGHHVEYLYHLVKYKINHSECPDFIFLTHPGFPARLATLDLPDGWNKNGITIIHPSADKLQMIASAHSRFSRKDLELTVIRHYAIENDVRSCYLMSLDEFRFNLGTYLAKTFPCSIRGILFSPFSPMNADTEIMKNLQWRAKQIRRHLELLWMIRNKKLDRIFVLNDPQSAEYLNNKYNKKHLFDSLPDPIFEPSQKNVATGIFENNPAPKYRFLIFGALSSRKGVFVTLEALDLLPIDIAGKVEIIFAGMVSEKEDKQFELAVGYLRQKRPEITIKVNNAFIPYEDVPSLFLQVDCVLMPYSAAAASSGIIGHSALYGKPVIGPASGLIGRLIKNYELGITVGPVNASKISSAIIDFIDKGYNPKKNQMRRFVQERQPDKFVARLIGT